MVLQEGAAKTGESWRDDYQTPAYILSRVDDFYDNAWFDPCPINPTFDGLNIQWPENTYINPRFSEYLAWVSHGLNQFKRSQDNEQIWIMTHDSSTKRFKLLMRHASAICLLDERVKFIDPRTGLAATQPSKSSTLMYLGRRKMEFKTAFSDIGSILFT